MIIDPRKLIINRHEKQDSQQKTTTVLLFIMFWGLLLYLVRPIILVIGWGISYYIFDSVAHDMDKSEFFSTVFTRYLPLIALMSLSFWAWAGYNRMRFSGKKDKRRASTAYVPTIEDVVQSLAEKKVDKNGQETILNPSPLSVEQIAAARGAYGVVFYFDEYGRIKTLDACASPSAFMDTVASAAKRGGRPPARPTIMASADLAAAQVETIRFTESGTEAGSMEDGGARPLSVGKELAAAPALINMLGQRDMAEKRGSDGGASAGEAPADEAISAADLIQETEMTPPGDEFDESVYMMEDEPGLIPPMTESEAFLALDYAIDSLKRRSL